MAGDVEVGIFGGSAFYSFLDDAREVEMDTPYGQPSAPVKIGEIGGRKVGFLPRHGRRHEYPPHRINYRANVWALSELGATRIIGPGAAGSLKRDVEPGQFVICDQLVDRTSGRADTFYDGPPTTHISFADPYCPELRQVAVETARAEGIDVHDRGTVVTVQGPRFSTRAESKWFQEAGWDVITMTQYPEACLARELESCYVNISLVTDYDVGIEDVPPVTKDAVIDVLNANNDKLRRLLFALVPRIPRRRNCICSTALQRARFD